MLSRRIIACCAERGWYAGDARNDPGFSDDAEHRGRRSSGFELPPATDADLVAAERELGMQLPEPLRTVLGEVANGQFGPGYGIYGVPTTVAAGPVALDMLALYREGRANGSWPTMMIPVCYWGCDLHSAFDTNHQRLVRICTDTESAYAEKHDLGSWFEAWIAAGELFDAVHPDALDDVVWGS